MATNYENRFGDCDKVARAFHKFGDGLDMCVRWVCKGCAGCRFEFGGCDELEKYDASFEWLQEECDE